MPKYDYDIGVIGGGAAGLTVAAGVSQLGARTLLIEKEPHLGGDCLHYGCVPSKTLIQSAHVYHLMKNAARFGLPQVETPPVDFDKVASRIRGVIDRIQHHDSVERFCSLGVQVEFGGATFADEHTVEVHGRRWTAARWVIATGSSPFVPEIPGLQATPFMTNKEIFFLASLPKSLVIFGAGPVAVELAQAFNRLGTKVTVIQRGGQILSREDSDMAGLLLDHLMKEGLTFHLDSVVREVSNAGWLRRVMFEDGEGFRHTLEAEAILVALGRSVNVDGMGLMSAGVDYSPKGIEVDARLRTSQKHIYAAGDVIGHHQFTHAAGYEGGIVVANAVLHLPRKADYTWFPHCTYTDPELASIGMNEKQTQKAGLEYSVWKEEFRNNDRSLAEGYDTGFIKMIVDRREKPVGVQILGPRAGEIMSEWVAVMNGKIKVSTLAGSVHPYPTLGEINKRVAGSLLASKLFSETVRRKIQFFFNLKGRACELRNPEETPS
ncbi:MAG: FAD-dependent oxidoreductase [Deltaproteobacteria bacterium]|nr:FAD-dependent oxidoreductase [Deltaproteobacteria bacterium]